jgi:hypothetical protein
MLFKYLGQKNGDSRPGWTEAKFSIEKLTWTAYGLVLCCKNNQKLFFFQGGKENTNAITWMRELKRKTAS